MAEDRHEAQVNPVPHQAVLAHAGSVSATSAPVSQRRSDHFWIEHGRANDDAEEHVVAVYHVGDSAMKEPAVSPSPSVDHACTVNKSAPFVTELVTKLLRVESELGDLRGWVETCFNTNVLRRGGSGSESSMQASSERQSERPRATLRMSLRESGMGKTLSDRKSMHHQRLLQSFPHERWDITQAVVTELDLLQDADAVLQPALFEEILDQSAHDFVESLRAEDRDDWHSSERASHIAQSLPAVTKANLSKVFRKKRRARSSFFPVHPSSKERMLWDVFLGLLLIYDMVTIPVEAFVTGESVVPVMTLVGSGCWTSDFVFNFFTAYYSGLDIVVDFRKIALHYSKGWLISDLALLVMDWVTIVSESKEVEMATSMRALRVARFIRLVRLIRLAKLRKKLVLIMEVLKINTFFAMIIGCGELMACLLATCHLVACAWVFLGRVSKQNGTHSWMNDHLTTDMDAAYLYSLGYHWALSQFQGSSDIMPSNRPERVFAAAILGMSCLLFPFFISSITSRFMVMQSIVGERAKALDQIRELFSSRRLSRELMNMARKQVVKHFAQTHRANAEKVLEVLPPGVRSEILMAVRAECIQRNEFLKYMKDQHRAVMRGICIDAMATLHVAEKETVFQLGKLQTAAIFVEQGNLHYELASGSSRQQSKALRRQSTVSSIFGKVQPDAAREESSVCSAEWFCEQCLWTIWTTVGQLTSVGTVRLVSVESEQFANVISTVPAAKFEASIYARAACRSLRLREASGTDRGFCIELD